MKLLPYETFEIQSPLSLDVAVARLQDDVEPKKFFRFFWQEHDFFEGDVSRDGFKIRRIHYSRSSPPVVKGTFRQMGNGVNMEVTMALPRLAIPFMIIFFAFMTKTMLADGSTPLFVPLVFIAFVYIVTTVSFWNEVKKAKKELLEIFQGQIKTE